jgi:anti-anti-sigma factor
MNHRLTSPQVGIGRRNESADADIPQLTLVSPRGWTHTLVLTGELNNRSASQLEEEIECLCQEGVTELRLDLRQLESFDSGCVAVLTFRSQECQRRGCDLVVLPGSQFVRVALEEAGVSLLSEESEVSAPSGDAASGSRRSEARSPAPGPIDTKLVLRVSDHDEAAGERMQTA